MARTARREPARKRTAPKEERQHQLILATIRSVAKNGLPDTTTATVAREAGLSFVKLSGNVGCLVNGAGLAMATMDLVKYYGGEPANFLDIGGSSNPEKVVNAFHLILDKGGIKAILINIFGGIMRCDVVAEGVVAAAKKVGIDVPVVVRLEGTNVERGKQILEESGLELQVGDSMGDAAQKVVAAAEGK